MHGAITALVYGVPALILDLGSTSHSKLAGLAELLDRSELRVTDVPAVLEGVAVVELAPLQARVDAHLDRIAALAQAAGEGAAAPERPAASADHEVLRRRLLEERLRYADLVEDVAADRDAARAELVEAKRYIASLVEALEAKESTLRTAHAELSARREGGALER
jgi:hypothetical protein